MNDIRRHREFVRQNVIDGLHASFKQLEERNHRLGLAHIRLYEALQDLVGQCKHICGDCEQWLSLEQAEHALDPEGEDK